MSSRNLKKQRVSDSSDSVETGPLQPQLDIDETETETESETDETTTDETESESETEPKTEIDKVNGTEIDKVNGTEINKVNGTEIISPVDHKQKGVAIVNILDDFPSRWVCTLCGIDQRLRRLPQCEHCICDDCIMPFITDIIKNSAHGFKCPKRGCSVMWTVEHCLDYVPREVGDRWIQAIREARVLADPQYIFCPFPSCGAPFVDDLRGFRIRACTSCWRIFCTSCRVDWHMGMSCSQYQALVWAADQWFP